MTTAEIAALYIKHADDFRLLLPMTYNREAMCVIDNCILVYDRELGRWWEIRVEENMHEVPAALAVAAMTEAWRERLWKKHDIWFHTSAFGYWSPRKPIPDVDGSFKLDSGGAWAKNQTSSWLSLPEAICAAVAALAAEKRAEAGMEKMGFERVEAGMEQIAEKIAHHIFPSIASPEGIVENYLAIMAEPKIREILERELKPRKDTP